MTDSPTPIIGVEVHIELTTNSKMFCGCSADHFAKDANTQTCPVCLGLPGALPVPNGKAIEDTLLIGLALNCQINLVSHFDRKQYFYPDLPKGYQISQYDQPFCYNGYIELDSGKRIGIERVHLEEDTAKLQHTTIEGKPVSLVDFNRGGVPLVEIVSRADLSSSAEVKEYLKKIYQIVRTLGVSTADMEKGQMRLEPTVNVKIGDKYTPLVELKNINSFNFAAQAIDYEVKRQVDEFERSGVKKSENNKTTRGYDSVRKNTFPQREKEEAKDYRYFPEPDIPPLSFSSEQIDELRSKLPELPEALKQRLIETGIRTDYAALMVADEELKVMVNELVKEAKLQGVDINKVLGELINGKIQWKDKSASVVVGEVKKMAARVFLLDEELKKVVEMVLAANPKVVDDYRKGKLNSIQYLLGQVMRSSQGMAKAEEALRILKQEMDT